MKSRSRGWMRGPPSRGGCEARMLPREPARSPPRPAAAPCGRAGVTVLDARPVAPARDWLEAAWRLTPAEDLAAVLLEREGVACRETPAEEREALEEDRWALEEERLTPVDERRFCELTEGLEAALLEREAEDCRETLEEDR